jgi:hypothetical protein
MNLVRATGDATLAVSGEALINRSAALLESNDHARNPSWWLLRSGGNGTAEPHTDHFNAEVRRTTTSSQVAPFALSGNGGVSVLDSKVDVKDYDYEPHLF